MIVSIESDNPNLSHILCKNPNSLPRLTSLRKGFLTGWYNTPQKYLLRFIDASDELSFPDYVDQEYEYLSNSKYDSPVVPIAAFSTLLDKLDLKYDSKSKNVIELRHVRAKEKTINTIQKYLNGVEFIPIGTSYLMRISNEDLVTNTTDLFLLLCLFITADNQENIYIQDEFIIKYFKRMAQLDLPYFIRYVFKTNFIKSNRLFEEVKEYLNAGTGYEIRQGSNFDARMSFAAKYLQNVHVVDIGCGEGRYVTQFAKRNLSYSAIDLDQECIEKVSQKLTRNEITNCSLYNSLDEFLDSYDPSLSYVVLCTEVIEHMTEEELKPFLKKVRQIKGTKLFTTPNVYFNQFYQIESRHIDHRHEYSYDELIKIFPKAQFVNIGDCVNGIPTTFGIIEV